MNNINFRQIGTIYTPFNSLENMPIQPAAADGVKGTVEVFPEFTEGLSDLEGFSHIYLIFHLHLSTDYRLKVKPFLDDELRGVFSTRAPKRPNPIGISVVKLISVKNNILEVENLDIFNGTPLLDIKPAIPDMYNLENCKIGWIEKSKNTIKEKKSDGRYLWTKV
ncbi:MAG: tRNA (N6-threonylcarbamoyladenosine(37)-N6)-methyltransferase TrmO [Melioribacteraceae bacterium]|nr:tRNA (N6-threonylcarbamoyladenosine(37)-N6)-methyltransferase TrmO [Melioribacteraceae bacterium]